jgi:class III poly(R)-hydroxyalkanoic acid synthase PhaE subunit
VFLVEEDNRMKEIEDPKTDLMAQWVTMHENFWKEWLALGERFLANIPALQTDKTLSGFTPPDVAKMYFDWWEKWGRAMYPQALTDMPMFKPFTMESIQKWGEWPWFKALGDFGVWYQQMLEKFEEEARGEIQEGLGVTVFNRIDRAVKIYVEVMDFWIRIMGLLQDVSAGKPASAEDTKKIYEEWMKNYRSVMESLWGQIPSSDIRSTMKAFTGTSLAASDFAWSFAGPVISNLSQLPGIFQRMIKGDKGVTAELGGVFIKNYEDTMGRALLAPSLGYFREFNERINKAVYGYVQYNNAKTAFFSMLYRSGIQAAEKVLQRFAEFKIDELTPETVRELYRIWWNVNEETYQEVFRTKEFRDISQQLVERGLLLRKWCDELAYHMLKFTSIPSKQDMDEIYKAIYDLKKDVRALRKAITEIEKKEGCEVLKKVPSK